MWKLLLASAALGAFIFIGECRKGSPVETAVPLGQIVMPAPESLRTEPSRVVYADPIPLPPPVPYVPKQVAAPGIDSLPAAPPPERPPENVRSGDRPAR